MILPRQLSMLPFLMWHPYATRRQILAFQSRQLRHLITHAYYNVPYYRTLFDRAGVKPEAIRTRADLSSVPVTSKGDLLSLTVEEITARGVNRDRLIEHKTSGSSGEPSIIRRTRVEERILGILRLRAMRYFGLRIRDKRVGVLLAPLANPRANDLVRKLVRKANIYRGSYIDCLQSPERIAQRLRELCPDVLGGFPGVLMRVAEAISEGDRFFLKPRFVLTAGEVLTPLMRKQIQAAFRAPVFEIYASHEFNMIAWQCKETGEFHVCDDGLILEVIKDGRPAVPGERGEVVATNLHSFAMPYVRYRLGDLVTKGSEACPCGQPFSTIKSIQGRMIDYLTLPGGQLIHPYEIITILVQDTDWIRQYRLVQEREDRVVVQVVPCTPTSSQRVNILKDRIACLLGPDTEIDVSLVAEIPLEPSGKFRVSRSLVHSEYDGLKWHRV